MSQRSGSGRHRSRRRHVTVPTVVGSVAMAAAASGVLVMPQAAGSPNVGDLNAISARPQGQTETTSGRALDTVVAAGRSLSAQASETAEQAHVQIVEQQRREAAAQAARAAREAKRWVLPLASYSVSASFGSFGGMWAAGHTGTDLAAPSGTAVRALSSGEVISAGWDGPYGQKVVVRHWDGTETWYCHLSRILTYSGDVASGEVIGRVGSTGNSTGPHLHLEVHPEGGGPVNPRAWLEEQGLSL